MSGYIDAHHHLWVRSQHPQTWMNTATMGAIDRDFDEDDYDTVARAAGVIASVVVQSVNDAAETGHLLQRAERSSVVAGVVGWGDLAAPDLADTVDAWRAAAGDSRLVGLRHVVEGEPDPAWLLRNKVLRGLRTLGDAGMTYDLLVRESQLPAAIAAVRAAPATQFVLDHIAKPPLRTGDLASWESLLRTLAAEPNVTAKVSGLVTEADWAAWSPPDLKPAVDAALGCFGPSRLMFGTDWPVCQLAGSYADVVASAEDLFKDLSVSERYAVFTGTARQVYGV